MPVLFFQLLYAELIAVHRDISLKTIGLLGGMSWESTQLYYKLINQGIHERLGGLHSAELALISVDFQEIEAMQMQGRWDLAAKKLVGSARHVEAAGADFLVICTNTMHKVVDAIQQAISIPILHIADATAEHIQKLGFETVGLLGTRFTMEEDFYRGRLQYTHGFKVLVPSEMDRKLVHQVIYGQLCLGVISDASRREYLRIIGNLHHHGAEAIIAGCTEIGLLVQQEHTEIPLLDTTAIHAKMAVDWALS